MENHLDSTVLTDKHSPVSVVGDGEQMGRHLSLTFALVLLDDVHRVDGETSVWVDDDAEQSRVGLQGDSKRSCYTYMFKHEKYI